MAIDFNSLPICINLPPVVRGDSKVYKFAAKGVCWTPVEPTDVDPDYPWQEKYWWAEARSGFATAARYHNGWVPWYGNPPSTYVWWVKYSLGAIFEVTAEWDNTNKQTLVTMHLSSGWSTYLRASSYHWSCRAGDAVEKDGDGVPTKFDNFTTWGTGELKVKAGYTLYAPLPEGV